MYNDIKKIEQGNVEVPNNSGQYRRLLCSDVVRNYEDPTGKALPTVQERLSWGWASSLPPDEPMDIDSPTTPSTNDPMDID
jgi:hypothetical protein